VPFPSGENWELIIEHWSVLKGDLINAQFSIPNSDPIKPLVPQCLAFPSGENWELIIEHWSVLRGDLINAQRSSLAADVRPIHVFQIEVDFNI
jgi:hypothetical protein